MRCFRKLPMNRGVPRFGAGHLPAPWFCRWGAANIGLKCVESVAEMPQSMANGS
jgi:hypothetical protein